MAAGRVQGIPITGTSGHFSDIFTLIRTGTAPPRFGMSTQELANLQYWVFGP